MNNANIDDAQQQNSSAVETSENKNKNMKKNNKRSQEYVDALAINKKMVKKYQSQFPEIPTMTSKELIERWKQQDREDDERDDSIASSSISNNSNNTYSTSTTTT